MFSGKRSSYKFMKRAGVWKSGQAMFNPETFIATSYDWWIFVRKINGKVVFNNFTYSPTTTRHQYLTRNLLSELGIKIDAFVQAPRGLQNLQDAYECAQVRIKLLQEEIDKPRTHAAKNAERRAKIRDIEREADFITKLMTAESKAFKKRMAS